MPKFKVWSENWFQCVMIFRMVAVIASMVMLNLASEQVPALPREFRGAWVATVDNIDWPSKPGLSVDKQRAELDAVVSAAAKLKMNALVFQVRPHADAMYASPLEPWSYYLTGEQGRSPEPAWDPLAYLIEKSHAKGIQVHAWFNPYRVKHPKQLGPLSAESVAKTHPEAVYTYGTYLWMDPGQKFVQDRSYDVFMDVVDRYDVDGIHIDDYFYPYPITSNGKTVDFPDQKTYEAYRASGGRMSKSDWRRDNVNKFVKRVYEGVKKRKPWVMFGISPFGIYRPNMPQGIAAGIDQYEALSADALKWLKEGWCDYMAPQLYWSIESKGQPYKKLLDWWLSQNVKGRHVWPGLYTSRLEPSNASFSTSQISRQIAITRQEGDPSDTGHIHFSMKALQNNWLGISDVLSTTLYKEAALVPPLRSMSKKIPGKPKLSARYIQDGETTLSLIAPATARYYAFQVKDASGKWTFAYSAPVDQRLHTFDASKVKGVAVRCLDAFGNASSPIISAW